MQTKLRNNKSLMIFLGVIMDSFCCEIGTTQRGNNVVVKIDMSQTVLNQVLKSRTKCYALNIICVDCLTSAQAHH